MSPLAKRVRRYTRFCCPAGYGRECRNPLCRLMYASLSAAVPESSDAREADLREWRENRAG